MVLKGASERDDRRRPSFLPDPRGSVGPRRMRHVWSLLIHAVRHRVPTRLIEVSSIPLRSHAQNQKQRVRPAGVGSVDMKYCDRSQPKWGFGLTSHPFQTPPSTTHDLRPSLAILLSIQTVQLVVTLASCVAPALRSNSFSASLPPLASMHLPTPLASQSIPTVLAHRLTKSTFPISLGNGVW